jgi:hypothetical protein
MMLLRKIPGIKNCKVGKTHSGWNQKVQIGLLRVLVRKNNRMGEGWFEEIVSVNFHS